MPGFWRPGSDRRWLQAERPAPDPPFAFTLGSNVPVGLRVLTFCRQGELATGLGPSPLALAFRGWRIVLFLEAKSQQT